MDALTGYKETEALLAALEVGIFAHLQEASRSVGELAVCCGVDVQLLSVFLLYLESRGFLTNQAGQWSLSEAFNQEWKRIEDILLVIAWEKRLKFSWVTADELVLALKQGQGQRPFDLHGLTNADEVLYIRAMYEKSVRVLGWYLKRVLKAVANPRILELGRSPGYLLKCMLQQTPEVSGVVAVSPELQAIALRIMENELNPERRQVVGLEDNWDEQEYDLVCINNTIHYWQPAQANEFFLRVRRCLVPGGVLAIHDFFLDPATPFTATILPDWITHGGCNFLYLEEVQEAVLSLGFTNPRVSTPAGLNSKLMLFDQQRSENK